MTTTTDLEVDHQIGCPAERLESYTLSGRDTVHAVTRCMDCGAQAIAVLTEAQRIEPGSPEWLSCWVDDPRRIYDRLTEEEKRNPDRNPLHPYSSSWPPGHAPTARTIESEID